MAEPSIHWRQRWWYALWVALLIAALGFWRWWETPAMFGKGHVVLSIRVADLPPGCRVEVWAGPAKTWKPESSAFQGNWPVLDPAKPLPIPPVEIRAGLRRWHQGYIPRLTADLVVVRLDPPQGSPKFFAYNLSSDLNTGLAGPHRRLYVSQPVRWVALSEDASRPSPLLP
ncbi:MAG TPA: hypothetical protein VL181_04165 [Holophagaceae bacterium]|nr:hypothetical protein [Holophagaceae bacterium]